jgi:hypothetical protein
MVRRALGDHLICRICWVVIYLVGIVEGGMSGDTIEMNMPECTLERYTKTFAYMG